MHSVFSPLTLTLSLAMVLSLRNQYFTCFIIPTGAPIPPRSPTAAALASSALIPWRARWPLLLRRDPRPPREETEERTPSRWTTTQRGGRRQRTSGSPPGGTTGTSKTLVKTAIPSSSNAKTTKRSPPAHSPSTFISPSIAITITTITGISTIISVLIAPGGTSSSTPPPPPP